MSHKNCIECGGLFGHALYTTQSMCTECRIKEERRPVCSLFSVEEKLLLINTLRNLSRAFSFNRVTVDAPNVANKRQAILDIETIIKKLTL